jgi:dephospho-CoA kinase
MTFVVGLTGGIGSGKSTVAELFRALGVPVIDTDEIAHRLTAPREPAVAAIGAALGAEFITDGALDRDRLRARVFADPAARRTLEAILHPLIRRESAAAVAQITAPYALLVVPLLIESGNWRERVQRVLVVTCSEAQQIARAAVRDRLAPAEVRAIIAAQASPATRLAAADDVLNNDGDPDTLHSAVNTLHQRYLALAAATPSAR